MAQRDWYKLDNVAKIMPSSIEGADTRVFRLVCELKEEVDPDILQRALDKTLPEFPHMNCCLRRGIFWYYLDSWKGEPKVSPEDMPALSPLYITGQKDLLFRLTYFRRRINLEVFHSLADGTGGFVFLTHIVTHYLAEKHGLPIDNLMRNVSSIEEKGSDAFRQYYEGTREYKKMNRKRPRRNFIREMFPTRAYQISGDVDEDLWEHLIEGTVSTGKLIDAAHSYGVTVGIFIVALYVEALLSQMSVHDRRRKIVVSVPVDLRQFYPSATTRNFFGAVQIVYDPERYDGTLESVVSDVRDRFEECLDENSIADTMNSYAALEHNYALKMVPLFLKYPALRGYNFWMKKGVTSSVSNVGKVELPEELMPYVEKFCSFMANRTAFMCISSFADKTVFGIVSCFTNHNVFMRLFRRLSEMGISVELATNDYDMEQ